MGRRSRKRTVAGSESGSGDAGRSGTQENSRAERDAARMRRRREAAERAAVTAPGARTGATRRRGSAEPPPAPWGKFPLTELVVLLGIGLAIGGVIVWGTQGRTMIAAGFALMCLSGLEVSIREHFAGHRSHSSLLAGAAAVAAMIGTLYAAGTGGLVLGAVLVIGAAIFAASFWGLRRTFRRRSGGLSFR